MRRDVSGRDVWHQYSLYRYHVQDFVCRMFLVWLDARHQYLLYRCHVLDFMRRIFLVVMLVAMSGIGIHALDAPGCDAMVIKNHIAPF